MRTNAWPLLLKLLACATCVPAGIPALSSCFQSSSMYQRVKATFCFLCLVLGPSPVDPKPVGSGGALDQGLDMTEKNVTKLGGYSRWA